MAKSAGVRFFSLMCQPDESLAKYNVWQNGQIVDGKVFCAASMTEGDYIVFCNPMRHWGDVQIWTNKHEGLYTNSFGTLAAPKLLLLSLGRDTDGDFIQLIKASSYPAIASEIKKFASPPIVKKLPKVPLKGSFQQIAINSMNDLTGIVASLLGRSRAAGCELHYLDFPPNTAAGEKKGQNMRIIDFLSQELQIAVDSLKSSYPNNQNGLKVVSEYLDSIKIPDPENPGLFISTQIPWLKGFKNPQVYQDYLCPVDEQATDTISKLVKVTNSYWKKPDLEVANSAYDYHKVLFTSYKKEEDYPDWVDHLKIWDFQYKYAHNHNIEYGKDMKQAGIEQKNNPDGEFFKLAVQFHKAKKPSILAQINPQTGEPYSVISWAAAYWHACNTKDGKGGLAFNLFPDEIIAELKKKPDILLPEIPLFHCIYTPFGQKYKTRLFNISVKIRVVNSKLSGFKNPDPKDYKCLEISVNDGPFLLAGAITTSYANYIPLGQVRTMHLFSIEPESIKFTTYPFKDNICEYSFSDKDNVLHVGYLRDNVFSNPQQQLILWDKQLIPELSLSNSQENKVKFIFQKQQFGNGQGWKYHPKSWIPANYGP
jgi:hypothetical protein